MKRIKDYNRKLREKLSNYFKKRVEKELKERIVKELKKDKSIEDKGIKE